MKFSRLLFLGSILIFGIILLAGVVKQRKIAASQGSSQEIILKEETSIPVAAFSKEKSGKTQEKGPVQAAAQKNLEKPLAPAYKSESNAAKPLEQEGQESEDEKIDRLNLLFNTQGAHLPIVTTVRYSPRVPWVKDRSAWIVDYASHYQTSKHFISRSLKGTRDYFASEISPGDRFNVFNNDIGFEFYLVVDISRCKMRFYYCFPAKRERVLLKTYDVVVGRKDEMSPSGCLTPLGTYKLGSKIAVYKPGIMGTFRKQKAEMIQIFGTRWIPFEEEVAGCTEPSKGYGIHGEPWQMRENGTWQKGVIGDRYASDGCIRLATNDMEELFAIIVTKPTLIEIVRDLSAASTDYTTVAPAPVFNP